MIVKSEPQESNSSERSPNVTQETENSTVSTIKIESSSISDNEDDEKRAGIIDTDTISVAQPYQLGTENSIARATLLSGTATASSIPLNASTPVDDKYCNVCDIKFKYMSSYVAHKKSYCRNIQNDLDIGSVPSNQATSVIATTCSSPNQASVVTT